ncbi:MAG: ribbon-helix-helix protein, CopG family [Saprospiraceae bacterium]
MSKAISLKMDDSLFEASENDIKRLGVSRNKFINDAVAEYIKKLKKERIRKQFEYEIPLIRESTIQMNNLINSLEDGNQLL